MIVTCDCDEQMILESEESRQEWYEGVYCCSYCDKIKIHRKEFDQNGLVTFDGIDEDSKLR